MAAAKTSSSGKAGKMTGRKVSTASRKTNAKRKSNTTHTKRKSADTKKRDKKNTVDEINEYQDHQAFEFGITLFVLGILSLFFYLSYFRLMGNVGIVIGGFAFGIFGWFAWFLPLFCITGFVFYEVNAGDSRVFRRIFSFCGIVLSMLGLSDLLLKKQIITEYYTSNHVLHRDYFECMFLTCRDIIIRGKFNGGLLGRAMTLLFSKILGEAGACIILVVLLLFFLYLFYGLEWMKILRKRNAYRQEIAEQIQNEEDYQKPSYRVFGGKKKEGDEYAGRVKECAGEGTDNAPKKWRTLQRVPRVQSFDLQQLNKRMDKMEHTLSVSGLQEEADKKEASLMQKQTKQAQEGKKKQKASQSTVQEEPVAAQETLHMAAGTNDPAVKTETAQEIQIPIYRNEMDEKFGKKKKTSSSVKSQEAALVKDMTSSIEPISQEVSVPSGKPAHAGNTKDFPVQQSNAAAAVSGQPSAVAETVEEQKEKPYEFPPVTLLHAVKDSGKQQSDKELRTTASKLQETLKSFNVNVQMGAVTCGPTVTRYEILPEQGVRVSKITNLADDLKLSMAAPSIRIEAPIPGKAAVGVEVPNPVPSTIAFRELLEGEEFKKAKSDLTFAVGKDIAGKLILADIAKMPHLLIAGATGSGKSVCINTLIMSIIYKANPKDVKLIMIDPKVVELSVYNGIPHLFCPVVTDAKEAAAALNWAVREMMERYNKFKELGVRNINGYNEKLQKEYANGENHYEKMPYLVVIVDEFADLMMVASKEVEDAVCRLAQLARAAGIHLVLATQRPSVNVITGVIKANIPSRIAFSVSSAIDSRTILDKGGAEKLLGKGDMLFFPSGYSEPVRVQGALVSDTEVSDVVDFLCRNNETPEYNHAVTEIVETPETEVTAAEKKQKPDRDDYFEDAGRFVIELERAAAGQLQRRFSIGFNRAGRIIDQLHKAGVIGPAEGTKPRKVLMTMEEFDRMLTGEGENVSQEEMESMVKEMEQEPGVTEEISL